MSPMVMINALPEFGFLLQATWCGAAALLIFAVARLGRRALRSARPVDRRTWQDRYPIVR